MGASSMKCGKAKAESRILEELRLWIDDTTRETDELLALAVAWQELQEGETWEDEWAEVED